MQQNSEINIEENPNYFDKLRKLNEHFFKWIEKYMAEGPYYVFTPVCKEYIQYIERIEKEFPFKDDNGNNNNSTVNNKATVNSQLNENMKIQFNSISDSSTTSTETTTNRTFDNDNARKNLKRTRDESPERKVDNDTTKRLFNFNTTLPAPSTAANSQSSLINVATNINNSNVNTNETNENITGTEEDEDAPPKPQSVKFEEADAVYTVKCKLYFKEQGNTNFKEKGIGLLYIKKLTEKYQLLIRAETVLGNILLNILLSSKLPMAKVKNGVLITCEPNPPIDRKGTTVCFLIRVGEATNVDDFYAKLKQYACD